MQLLNYLIVKILITKKIMGILRFISNVLTPGDNKDFTEDFLVDNS